MKDHSIIEELLAVDSLGGLSDDDARLLAEARASHGADCPECLELEYAYSETAGRLAFSLEPREVSASAADALFAGIAGEAGEGEEDEEYERAAARPGLGRGHGGRPRAWVRGVAIVAAAAMLVAAGISIGSISISHEPSQQQALVSYLQSGAKLTQFQATQGGRLAYVSKPGSDQVYLVGADLATPPSGHEYQLWTISGKTPAPGPTFVPSNGRVLLPVTANLSGSQVMAVTIEPAGGSLQPTTTPIFTAPISNTPPAA